MKRSSSVASLFIVGAMVSSLCSAFVTDVETLTADEQAFKAANLKTDGPAVIAFVRQHTLTEADRERIESLIAKLGDKSFRVREKASAELVDLGHKVGALLRPSLKNPDREVVRRAEECLLRVEKDEKNKVSLMMSAVRLLAVRKPSETAEVLLNYLPFADEEAVLEEIQTALVAVALREGKPEPSLIKALTETVALRRGFAGASLAGVAEYKNVVRKLLKDTEDGVRLRVGLALSLARDKEAVPTLIELLAKLPPEQLGPVEEFLQRMAQDKGPTVALGTDAASRAKCHDAWAVWWRERGATVDIPASEGPRPQLGYTLGL